MQDNESYGGVTISLRSLVVSGELGQEAGPGNESSWLARSPGKPRLGLLDRHGWRMMSRPSEQLSAGVIATPRFGTRLSGQAAWVASGPSGILKFWRLQRNLASHETGEALSPCRGMEEKPGSETDKANVKKAVAQRDEAEGQGADGC